MTKPEIVDRYEQHGLSHNPFAVGAEQQQKVFVTRGFPAPPPAGSGVMVQVIGDRGAGKTTQVQQWRRERPGPYFYVPPSPARQRWRVAPVADLVYADEVDRMPAPLRAWWFRRLASVGSTVVLGTHRDLSPIAKRCGLNVVTHQLGPIGFETLRAVAEERLRVAQLAAPQQQPDAPFTISDAEVQRVLVNAAGSLRSAERYLHELVAERVLADPRSDATL